MVVMDEYARTPTAPSASNALAGYHERHQLCVVGVAIDRAVPVISRFFGIAITMYHNEHGPPHFHVRHGEIYASVEILTGRLRGDLPPNVLRLVRRWMKAHRTELLDNWTRAQARRSLSRIAPLE